MNLNIAEWKPFLLGRLFDIKKGKRLTAADQEDGENNYIGAIDSNNGVANHIGQAPIHSANTISLSYNGSVGEAFYQSEPYWATDDVNALYSRYAGFNEHIGLFIATVIRQEKYKFSYGRKWTLENMNITEIKLPIQYNLNGKPYLDSAYKFSDDGFVPDWKFMEDYIQSLHYKPLATKNVSGSILNLNPDFWHEFRIGDLFDVKYGINLELTNCDETTQDDAEAVAFVSRTADNNGVSAYVKRIEGKEPQPAETITVAGGGSVLSTFVQRVPFYSGRDLYLLFPKEEISLSVKLFITTIISANQYRYSYGRQANKTLPYLELKLPVKLDSAGKPVIDAACKYSPNGFIPDWNFMERYMKSLPYGDKL